MFTTVGDGLARILAKSWGGMAGENYLLIALKT